MSHLCSLPNCSEHRVKSLSRGQFLATPWTIALQTSLSLGFSSKNTGMGCHFLLQGILLTQGSNPHLLCALVGGFFTTAQPEKSIYQKKKKNLPEDSAWRPVTVFTFLSSGYRILACSRTLHPTGNGHWMKVGTSPKER